MVEVLVARRHHHRPFLCFVPKKKNHRVSSLLLLWTTRFLAIGGAVVFLVLFRCNRVLILYNNNNITTENSSSSGLLAGKSIPPVVESNNEHDHDGVIPFNDHHMPSSHYHDPTNNDGGTDRNNFIHMTMNNQTVKKDASNNKHAESGRTSHGSSTTVRPFVLSDKDNNDNSTNQKKSNHSATSVAAAAAAGNDLVVANTFTKGKETQRREQSSRQRKSLIKVTESQETKLRKKQDTPATATVRETTTTKTTISEREKTKKKNTMVHPYYLYGKYTSLIGRQPHDPRKELIYRLYREPNKRIIDRSYVTSTNTTTPTTWVLPLPIQYPTRNHDSVLLEGGASAVAAVDGQQHHHRQRRHPILVTLLGRHSRYIQSMDLLTGKQWVRRTRGKDPSGNDIDDLNHVTAVLVDSLKDQSGGGGPRREIWLPCGFHNDRVNSEMSTDYVRIVDAETMKVRVGPKLPVAGGACVSKALPIIPNEPPMICTFAGTQGNHDRGTFLPFTQCYDRIRERWWSPFGTLPYGLDHGSLAVIPAGTCHRKDPARVLIFNFRTRPYGTPHPEFLAHDIPKTGWTLKTLKQYDEKAPKEWYVYHNVTDTRHLKNTPRDASGVVMANNGRLILNFGGTYRTQRAHVRGQNNKSSTRGRASMIRAFDVCRKEWNVVGDLGLQTFALQSTASESLGIAITCGGEAPLMNANSPFCFVSRWNNLTLSNPQSNVIDYVQQNVVK